VILLEGINDIGHSRLVGRRGSRHRTVTSAQIISAYQRLIAWAHAAGVKIFGATLTPFQGSFYWTPARRATRDAVNAWIRHSGAFDGVIDFASAVAAPRDRGMLNPAYDSGDHLHPNAAGYRAMADAVPLALLLRAARRPDRAR
jgi:lysophospholipase L1-like esterase